MVQWCSPYKVHVRGYPRRHYKGRAEYCHRVAWLERHGRIPNGLCVLHRCDNKRCVNVAHLFLGTKAQNSLDMAIKKRGTHGTRNRHAKLSWRQVRCIRHSHEPTRVLVKRYKVSRTTIKRIRDGSHWKE